MSCSWAWEEVWYGFYLDERRWEAYGQHVTPCSTGMDMLLLGRYDVASYSSSVLPIALCHSLISLLWGLSDVSIHVLFTMQQPWQWAGLQHVTLPAYFPSLKPVRIWDIFSVLGLWSYALRHLIPRSFLVYRFGLINRSSEIQRRKKTLKTPIWGRKFEPSWFLHLSTPLHQLCKYTLTRLLLRPP